MKVLLDMNIPLKYEAMLTKREVETVRWSDIGAPNAADTEIMAFARQNDCTVLTCDLDFSTILAFTHDSKPSIVQIRASIMQVERVVGLITFALFRYKNELEKGAILSIDLKKARLRLLPL